MDGRIQETVLFAVICNACILNHTEREIKKKVTKYTSITFLSKYLQKKWKYYSFDKDMIKCKSCILDC